MLNLIQDNWVPVVRRDGTRDIIAPWMVTADYATNPATAIATPRADFNAALVQLLIGLVQTACPPDDEATWVGKAIEPPSPEDLKRSLVPLAPAFSLDGDGARFMQDLDLHEGETWEVPKLLFGMPGEQTLKQNKDLFLKRGTVGNLCLPCAAMALYCVQANTGGFGKGHRTSLRGGGPLTSIVSGGTLWETIWFNVLEDRVFNPGHVPGAPDYVKVFPWLSSTRTSEKGEMTTPGDVHPSHMFFGMPLRVRLEVENSKKPCDICGEVHDASVSRFLIRSYGTNYSGNWNHPLTPYIFNQKTKETRSKKMSAGGIIYRHWLGLMQRAPGGTNDLVLDPARSVTSFKERKSLIEEYLPVEKTRIWSFGYEVDSGKARAWYEGTMPMVRVPPDVRPVFEATVEQIVMSAANAAFSLQYSTKHALYKEPKNVRGDFSFIDEDFWHSSERSFYELLGRIAPISGEGLESAALADLKREWVKGLSGVCLGLFDRYADSDLVGDRDPRRVVINRRSLEFRVSTRNPDLCTILHLPVPEGSVVKKRGKKSKNDDA